MTRLIASQMVVTTQFICEGLSVIFTFTAARIDDEDVAAALVMVPFFLALIPVFLPVLQKV